MSTQSTQPSTTGLTLTDEFYDQERSLWRGGFSVRSMFGGWLGGLLITSLLLTATLMIPELQSSRMVWLATGSMISLLFVVLIGLTTYRKLSHRYELTSQNLLHRTGIVQRKLTRLALIDIDDVSFHQGPLQSLLNVGRIEISTSDKDSRRLVMPGIAGPKTVATLIDRARRSERQGRGISN